MIDRLEKRKDLQAEKLKSVVTEENISANVLEERPKDAPIDKENSDSEIAQTNSEVIRDDIDDADTNDDSNGRMNLYLLIGLLVVIVINILILLFY